MPDKKARRARSHRPPPSAKRPAQTSPVRGVTVTSRGPDMRWLIGGGVALLAVIIIAVALGPLGLVGGAGGAPSHSPAAAASAGTGAAASHGPCPTAQPPALEAGQTRSVSLITPLGTIAIKVQADLSPIAAGNFVALASCGFYDQTVFHRTPTLADGTPFVIQGGDGQYGKVSAFDKVRVGSGGPGYTIQDEPVTTPYKRGTVAMARGQAPNSVGSQFFIVLDDKDGSTLGSANTYQIIGNVTKGMDVADSIYTASAGVELPANPVPITSVTVANP